MRVAWCVCGGPVSSPCGWGEHWVHGERAEGTLRGVHAAARRVVAYVVPPALRLLCRTAPTAARAPEGGAAEFLFKWVNSSAGVAPASDLDPACSDAAPARLQGELPPMDHYVSCNYDPESSGEWQRRGERGPRGSALFDSGGPFCFGRDLPGRLPALQRVWVVLGRPAPALRSGMSCERDAHAVRPMFFPWNPGPLRRP